MGSDNDFDYTDESSAFGGDGKLCGIVELQNSDYEVQINSKCSWRRPYAFNQGVEHYRCDVTHVTL
jgi:hypothetical protein